MTDGLIEIRPPQAPSEVGLPWLAAPLLPALLVAVLLVLRYCRAPRRRARRRLRRLRGAVRAGRIDGRDAAHALAALLHDGRDALPAGPADELAARLAAARFAAAPCDPAELEALLGAAARRLEGAP